MTEQARWTRRGATYLVIIAVIVAGTAMTAGVTAAAEVTSADRSIDQTELTPGESTTVTVAVELDESGDPAIYEEFDPAFANVEVVAGDPGPTVAAANDANDELVGVWDDSQTAMVQYEVTVPEDAEAGDTFTISGEAETADETVPIAGEDTIQVVGEEFTVSNVETNGSVEAGDDLEVTAVVENTGPVAGTQDVDFLFNGTVVSSDSVTLESGASENVTFTHNTSGVAPGNYEVAVRSADDRDATTVTVLAPPDDAYFAVDITGTNAPVDAGDTLDVTADIENTGDREATQDVEFLVDGTVDTVAENVTLAPNESRTLTFTHDTTGLDAGDYDVTVRSTDSAATRTVTVTTPPTPPAEADFAVEITDTNDSVVAGDPLEVTADIENTGDREATQEVTFLFNGTVAATESVTLAGGATQTVTFTHNTSGVAPGDYAIAVSSDDETATSSVTVLAPTDPTDDAVFELELKEISTAKGETLKVLTTVRNNGTETGTQDITFQFSGDGTTVTETLTLDGGEGQKLTFTHAPDVKPGTYEITVQSADEQVTETVLIDSEKHSADEPDETPSETDNETGETANETAGTDDEPIKSADEPSAPADEPADDGTPGFGIPAMLVAIALTLLVGYRNTVSE